MKNRTVATRREVCPIAAVDRDLFVGVMRSLLGKWKPAILWTLIEGTHRFGELKKALPGITQHMLTSQLRELERDGLVRRTIYPEIPPRVEYTITKAARDLNPIFDAFMVWFQKNKDATQGAAAARVSRGRPPG